MHATLKLIFRVAILYSAEGKQFFENFAKATLSFNRLLCITLGVSFFFCLLEIAFVCACEA